RYTKSISQKRLCCKNTIPSVSSIQLLLISGQLSTTRCIALCSPERAPSPRHTPVKLISFLDRARVLKTHFVLNRNFVARHMADYNKSNTTEEAPATNAILVVEDDRDIGVFLVEAITQETPYQALLVADGFQALNLVREITPVLVLLDYHLPGM